MFIKQKYDLEVISIFILIKLQFYEVLSQELIRGWILFTFIVFPDLLVDLNKMVY